MAAAQEVGTPRSELEHEAPREARSLVRIRHEDAKTLRWYFGENQIAGIAIASDMGMMLERAALMAIRLVPCKACGGSVQEDKPGTGSCPRRGGSYEKARRRWWQAEAKKAHKILKDTDADVAEWHRLGVTNVISGETIGMQLPDDLTKHCLKCQGTGMLERRRNNRAGAVTARPTGSSAHGNPDAMHAIDETGLELWSRTSRRLEEICTESPLARVALGMYYSPAGGSVGCLWRLTEAGETFLAQEPNPHKLSPDRLLENARGAHEQEPTHRRTALFSQMARECAEVWDHTCAVWVRLNPAVDPS